VSWPEGITVWALFLTLVAIAEQSQYSAQSADAALKTAQAMMDADRGFIIVDWDDLYAAEPEKPEQNWRLAFLWKCRNAGKTPVFLKRFGVRFVLLQSMTDLPESPDYGSPEEIQDEPLIAEKICETRITYLETDVPFRELEGRYRFGERTMFAYGYVLYSDIYGRDHTTRFALKYAAAPRPRRDFDGFRLSGPHSYNEYT
jgi:hypothetical protein